MPYYCLTTTINAFQPGCVPQAIVWTLDTLALNVQTLEAIGTDAL